MNPRLIRWLLKSYPSKWRAEYGAEIEDLLAGRPMGVSDICNVLWSGLRERLHEPFACFLFLSLLGGAGAFAVSLVFSMRVWIAVAAPAVAVLREQGVKPPGLVTVTPWEGFEVIFLGIPVVLTAFIMFAWVLVLTWLFFMRGNDVQKKRWVRSFVLCSGAMFVLSTLVSFLSWQNGFLSKLLEWIPDLDNAPSVSLGHYFELFALSTLGLTILLQAPIAVVFGLRFRAIRTLKSPNLD
jgi:Sec-independent protein secretion pathway component TatC